MSPLQELYLIIDTQKSIRTGRLNGIIGRLVRDMKRKDKRIESLDMALKKINRKYGQLINKHNKLKGSGPSMNFGQAIEAIKEGKRVAREGWNGKGMFIYLVKGTTISVPNLRNEAMKHVGSNRATADSVRINSHIDMQAADDSIVVGWLASQTDMLAEDWVIIS